MTNLALARQYRPKNFDELVGQNHVRLALSHALEQGRLHHAYLFTGTRGVGKTTIARIIAKSLNCETGITATPCGQCQACLEIDHGRFVDLIEIDAASRTKVEDTRDILDNVQYTPSKGRYKVYLIDEVHMLSTHSFNALLKTLEEPPAHVVFLLATTDPQKIPVTVLSRCLQLALKKLPSDQIKQQLIKILSAENVRFDEAALVLLAKSAKGSLRDALSLTDQAIAYCQNNITLDAVREMLGTLNHERLWAIFDALEASDAQALLATSQALSDDGLDFEQVLDEFITLIQYISLYQAAPQAIQYEELDLDKLAKYAKRLSPEDCQLYYQIALTGRRDLPLSPDPKQGFDMLLLRLLAFKPNDIESAVPAPKASMSTPKVGAQKAVPKTTVAPIKAVNQNHWSEVVAALDVAGMTKSLLEHTSLKSQDKNSIELVLDESQSAMLNDKQHTRISEAIEKHFGQKLKLVINVGKGGDTPAQQKADDAHSKKQAAISSIQQDDTVKALMDQFDAKVIPEAIKSNT